MKNRVIPTPAWVVGGVLFALAILCVVLGIAATGANFALPIALVVMILSGYALVVGYVYGDAKQRGMRHVMWTWLAILIPNGIGIILYFILREQMPHYCTKCGAAVRHGFAYCPSCGTGMAAACPQCHKVMEAGWAHCAFCGTRVVA